MINALCGLFRTLVALFKDQRDLMLEILALRQQLLVYKRLHPRPQLRRRDRLFWISLSKIWGGWRQALIIVKPDTVIGWHRQGFSFFWTKLSQRRSVGRPAVSADVRALIKLMAEANPTWGAPRIHSELLKLGIEISERTVSRLMPRQRKPPSQTWRTAPRQPLQRAGLDRLLHCADSDVSRAVRARCVGARPPESAALQRH